MKIMLEKPVAVAELLQCSKAFPAWLPVGTGPKVIGGPDAMKAKLIGWLAGGGAVLAVSSFLYVFAWPASDTPRRPVFDPLWELCGAGEACVAVQAPCGEWQPVNAAHEQDAAAYYTHLMTVVEETGMECVSTNLSVGKPAAYCKSGTCVLSQ